ncbi:DNA-processing protein DprA [Actinotalea sp. Marseille-Q4924]|uniref:DNA-processing protein DprA n=1 Tax=Actinotalea sp. Marseille-Q4924 TaxID=2866571 RepID=UPI001CE474E1|nr:DNA-processing protein DprA [Actinotalea sp. Marseille-Q4924]
MRATAGEDVLLARASWSRLVEPGDAVAGAVVAAMGPVEAWRFVVESTRLGRPGELGRQAGQVLPGSARAAQRLTAALERWTPRLAAVDASRELDRHRAAGGELLVPEDPRWPSGVADLGTEAPHALWVTGDATAPAAAASGAAVIGARACTHYGEHVTADLAAGVAAAGRVVVSGGAYGIDAAAHRAALATGGVTVAVLAGGVDRLYPAGNARLLLAVRDSGGALVSEVPPGSVPSRQRFLQRNRLIAALTGATVVVEAAWRSGALSTAARAAALLRPVGAVPGPVTSAASAGCHRLLRDGAAVCVTDAAEVLELLRGSEPALGDHPVGHVHETDGLDRVGRQVYDALPVRAWASVDSVTRVAGVSAAEARGALGVLELAGLARRDADRWRRAGPRADGPPAGTGRVAAGQPGGSEGVRRGRQVGSDPDDAG